MKVAENFIGIEHGVEGPLDPLSRPPAAYVAQRTREGKIEHDARGLVVAVLMSLVCWGALGFYLLS